MVCVFAYNLCLKKCSLRIAVGLGREQSYEETIWQKTQESSVSVTHRCSPSPPEHGSTSLLSLALPLARPPRRSANCILCLSIKIYFPFLFSFAFYHLLLIPLLLKSSLSLLARVKRAGLLKSIPSVRKRWPGRFGTPWNSAQCSVWTWGVLLSPKPHISFVWANHAENPSLASEQGHVQVALLLKAIQESQNKLAKRYRDDGVCRNKTTPWWTALDCAEFLFVFPTCSSWRSAFYLLAWRRTSL